MRSIVLTLFTSLSYFSVAGDVAQSAERLALSDGKVTTESWIMLPRQSAQVAQMAATNKLERKRAAEKVQQLQVRTVTIDLQVSQASEAKLVLRV